MLKYKLISLYFFALTNLCGCGPDKRQAGFDVVKDAYRLELMARLPHQVIESSGLEQSDDGNFWTMGDGGNGSVLFKSDTAGRLLGKLFVPQFENLDWEALARDSLGNLYIGDFGNNRNVRKNLRIIKVREQHPEQATLIEFRYPDQHLFPPPKKERSFDCEAFFWHQGYLYLFTKDRGRHRHTRIYRIPDQPGRYEAEPAGRIKLRSMITGADISPDGKLVALLGYGMVYLIETSSEGALLQPENRHYCLPVRNTGQAEGLLFLNNTDLLFTNEAGWIYRAAHISPGKRARQIPPENLPAGNEFYTMQAQPAGNAKGAYMLSGRRLAPVAQAQRQGNLYTA